MVCRKLLFAAMIVGACAAVQAQAPNYGLGKAPSAEELKAWDINISPEGKGLPAGSGTADEGAKIYAQKCAVCHGENLVGGQAPALAPVPAVPGHQSFPPFPVQVPFAPVLWDYIHRAMPMMIGPGTLNPNEVYSLTALLLYKNGVIKENDVMDAPTLSKLKMPNRDAYVEPVIKPWKP